MRRPAWIWKARRLLVLPFACMGLLLLCRPASAHAVLLTSFPPNGAVLEQAPDLVILSFDEPVTPLFGAVRVLDARGKRVNAQEAHSAQGDPSQLLVSLPRLQRGGYTVVWRVISADGHVVGGFFGFGVGAPAGAGPSQPTASGPTSPAIAFHGLWLLALTTLAGCTLFPFLVASGAPLRKLSRAALAASAVALVAALGFEGAEAAGVSWLAAFAPRVAGPVLGGTPFGHWWLASAVLLAILSWWQIAGRLGHRWLAGAALALLLAEAANGHAAATGSWEPLAVGIDWLHLAAVSAWAGALPALAVTVHILPETEASAAAARFSRLAAWAVPLVVVTGAATAFFHVAAVDLLWRTEYGQLLLVKVALAALLVAVGARNRWLLARAKAVSQAFRGSLRAEMGIFVAVIAATAWLASLPPALAAPGPATMTRSAGGLTANLEVSPNVSGNNRFVVRLRDAAGPVTGATVILDVTMVEMDMLPQSLTAQPVGDHYEATAPVLTMGGRWACHLLVHRLGRPDVTLDFAWTVNAGLS